MISVGIDIGFLTTKAVVMIGGEIKAHYMMLTGDSGYQAANTAVQNVIEICGLGIKDIDKCVSTGLGKAETPYDHEQAPEILCDVKGSLFFYPSARTIIDVGAESCRVVRCNANGRVLDFGLNDKCASGTGIFLDTMAKALGVQIENLGSLSLQAKEDITVTATCAVFAESEVVGLIARGIDKASILGGIHKSIANRIYGLANRVGISNDVILIGGGARNIGISSCLKALIHGNLLIPEEPQIVGAVGAAIIAQDKSK
jgi:predicted CoA-substrate-specific enzyme activase